ncbi:MAG: acyl carrier protein [Puniceicoccales bacterium]|jgi:acyl carrier protein|nr:acyl carrier protein [Puniceicoccales bacterium]
MAEKSIDQRVREVIVNSLNISEEKVTDNASFLDDLGADSLGTVELMMAFEDEFENEIEGGIPETDAEKLLTVKDVIEYIKSRIA